MDETKKRAEPLRNENGYVQYERCDYGSKENNGLCASKEKLRHISHKTMEVLEAERRIIAREIHDEIGGSLAAIKFLLEDLLTRNGDNHEIAEPLTKTVTYIQDTIKKTKRISAELRPTMLDDLGLKATIEWFSRKLQQSFPGVTFRMTIKIDEASIAEAQKIVIYRIIQKAITNAVQYGKADTIWLSLTQVNDRIEFQIKDNGRGLDMNTLSFKDCADDAMSGLTGIKERTEICGGSFFIRSNETRGTFLLINLPCQGVAPD